jgi:hypothetical protein
MITMSVVVMMTVVLTPFRGTGQLAAQIGGNQDLHSRPRPTGADRDAVLGEDVERTPADATHDDSGDALLAQPAGECTGLVLRRRYHLDVLGHFLVRVHLD